MQIHGNVLWITSDQPGWGTLGCLGNPHVRTPNLDRLCDRMAGTVDPLPPRQSCA